MKYLDLFSGYGGFSLGIQQAYESSHANRSKELGSEKDSQGDEKQGFQSEEGKDISSEERPASKCFADRIDERPLCIGFSEIDKYAIQVYNKHFGEKYECKNCGKQKPIGEGNVGEDLQHCGNCTCPMCDRTQPKTEQGHRLCEWIYNKGHKNYGDITTINPAELPDFDLLCGGFPCQAFSIAGKRAGFEDTRGTLIYDVFRIIKEKHPKLVLLENVKGLLSHDNGRTFKTIITSLAELGYAVEWQVLNAKNFGVPQNRERVFIIGHLGGFGGRQVFPIEESNGVYLEEITKEVSDAQRIYNPDGLAKSQKALGGGLGAKTGMYQLEDCKIRRLTPTECERLMGLPDGWTEGVSDTQRYKLCGNGVVVNVVKEIIKRINK